MAKLSSGYVKAAKFADKAFAKGNAALNKSSFRGVRPRLRNDNLSRQVLEDSYKVKTDIFER